MEGLMTKETDCKITETRIHALCREHFLPKSSLWAICPIMLAIASACIAWAIGTKSDITVLQTDSLYQKEKIVSMEKLYVEMNRAIDNMGKKSDTIICLLKKGK